MSGSTTLSVSNVVNVTVSLSPTAAALRNFGDSLVAGASDVISMAEAIRTYTGNTAVAADFGATAPETLFANEWFAQVPQPQTLQIARWAKTATSGILLGGILTPAQQLLSNFTAITAGALSITVDGTPVALTAINLSSAVTLPGVAALIDTALTGHANVTWDPVFFRFNCESATTGTTSSVAFVGTSTPLALALGWLSTQFGTSVPGFAAETALACTARLANFSNAWYGLAFADASLAPADHQAISAFILAASPSRIYALSSNSAGIPSPTSTTDVAYLLSQAGYRRTMQQYTTNTNWFAVIASLLARATTVNYQGNATAITLKFKQEPGVTPEFISQTAANALEAKNCNIFVNYDNNTAIVEQGVMADGSFIDEVVNLDALQNAVQTNVYNLLYQSTTKIPQTDAGMNAIVANIENTLESFITNGVGAPGQWNAAGFGQLSTGDYLSKGYYVYCPPIASQSQAVRETRTAPLIQVAFKMAGAVHFADVLINVNR